MQASLHAAYNNRKKDAYMTDSPKTGDHKFIGVGMGLGVAVGCAIGIALGNLALGIGIGIGAGFGIGLLVAKRRS